MRIILNPAMTASHINPEVYGNFSEHLGRCIYNGIFVGKDSPIPNVNGMRTDIVEALKKMRLPVLRWPGGCFADEYHWRDGIGPNETRKKMINTHWGGVVEDNSFGTHEFFELCRQIGCEPYVNGNVGSGTVQEMQDWIEYMTGDHVSPMTNERRKNGREEPWKLKYFAVGNENWGCGGEMTADFYADNYRRYAVYCRNYGENRLYKIACGPGTSMANPNYAWTETLMKKAGRAMGGLSMHYYTVPYDDWNRKGSATEFSTDDYYETVTRADFIEELIKKHGAIMDRYDPEKKVGLIVDEWGTWYDVEPGTNPGFLYQQNSMRDAMVAALTLNIFNRNSDRVHMANIAQLINVLQAVILTEGAQMLLTPTYHVFEMYKEHQGAECLKTIDDCKLLGKGCRAVKKVSSSASVKDGKVTVTLANLDLEEGEQISLRLDGMDVTAVKARILTGKMDAHNSFEDPEAVKPAEFTDITVKGSELSFALPPVSVLELTIG